MIKNILFISLTIFSFYLKGQNFTATYGFADLAGTTGTVDPSAAPVVAGLTFGSFSATGVSSNATASGRFSYSNWPLGGINSSDNYGDFTGSLSPFSFYKVTITVLPTYTLDLNSISFDVRRSGTGIRNYAVRSDLDNFTNNLAASTGTNTKLSVVPNDAFFWNYDSISTSGDQKGSLVTLGPSFDQLTGSLSFHFYAWNSEANGGSFSIDNVVFSGSVSNTDNPVGWREIEKKGSLHLFPNPGYDGIFNLESESEVLEIEVLTSLGCPLRSIKQEDQPKQIRLDLSDLPKGIYFLRISTKESSQTRKIVFAE